MDFEVEIKELIAKSTLLKKDEIVIEKPKEGNFGDYAFPCFLLSREMKKNPVQIAKELAPKMKLPKEIEKVQAIGPYLNFYINKKYLLSKIINAVLKNKERYGSQLQGKGKTSLIEHTSLNPNSSPHMGRVRNAITGDIITRILKFQGYKTETHFFVNDTSKQIALMLLDFKGKETFGDLLSLYVKMNEKLKEDPELEKKVFEILEKTEHEDKKTTSKLKKLMKIATEGQRDILKKIGIEFDYFDFESKYVKEKVLHSIVEKLKHKAHVFEDADGRLVLDQSGTEYHFEDKMKKSVLVLTRGSDAGKTYLYVVRDIAYHIDKASRKKDLNILVLGEDHKLYYQQLCAALELLKIPCPRVIHYSFTLIKEEDKVKKMATRKGDVVLLSELLEKLKNKAKEEIKSRAREKQVNLEKVSDAIAIGAIRYSIAKVELDKNVIFDLEEALNIAGNSAPYLQYSYVRASNILSKVKKFNKDEIEIDTKKTKKKSSEILFDSVNEREIKSFDIKEFSLAKDLANFQEIITKSTRDLKPHYLCNYAYNLAKNFNDFYENCDVLKSEEKKQRILLVMAFKQVMENCLTILGIPIIEEM
jgi:arginyl-tRNA synthetase